MHDAIISGLWLGAFRRIRTWLWRTCRWKRHPDRHSSRLSWRHRQRDMIPTHRVSNEKLIATHQTARNDDIVLHGCRWRWRWRERYRTRRRRDDEAHLLAHYRRHVRHVRNMRSRSPNGSGVHGLCCVIRRRKGIVHGEAISEKGTHSFVEKRQALVKCVCSPSCSSASSRVDRPGISSHPTSSYR